MACQSGPGEILEFRLGAVLTLDLSTLHCNYLVFISLGLYTFRDKAGSFSGCQSSPPYPHRRSVLE